LRTCAPKKDDAMMRFVSLFFCAVVVGAAAQGGTPSDKDERSADLASLHKLSDQKLWALATCALLTERNHGRHDLLAGCERTASDISGWKMSLRGSWSVSNREDLLNTLRWLQQEGHRARFERMGSTIAALTPDELNTLRAKNKNNAQANSAMEVAAQYYKRLGKKSILGWDYCRYVSVCRWGYCVGYLSEAEAWERIMPVARALQSTFDSWEDLGNNYLIGRRFWSLQQTLREGEEYKKLLEKFRTDSDSPWVKLPWNLDLAHDEKTGQSEQLRLPSGADRDAVRMYLRQVAEAARASDDPADSEWIAAYLEPVGHNYLDLLLLNRADPYIGRACLRCIERMATDEDKSLILGSLEMDYDLASVVRLRQWTQEAKPILVKRLAEHPDYLPAEWLEAVADLRDPATYEDLKWYFAYGTDPGITYEAIQRIPGLVLPPALIQKAWLRSGNRWRTRMVVVLLDYGMVEGLEFAADFLSKPWIPEDYRLSPRDLMLTYTDQRGSDEELRAWFQANKQRLQFDARTRKFSVSVSQ